MKGIMSHDVAGTHEFQKDTRHTALNNIYAFSKSNNRLQQRLQTPERRFGMQKSITDECRNIVPQALEMFPALVEQFQCIFKQFEVFLKLFNLQKHA